jgi:hypothetical protein
VAHRAEAQRAEHHDGQEDHSEGDALMGSGGCGPGGEQVVGVHRALSWPSGDCAVIVRAANFGVIPEDDAAGQAVVTRPDS